MRYLIFLGCLICVPLMAGTIRVYVANSAGDNITIIDPNSNKVIGEIKVSVSPHGIVPSPDKSRFYVSSESDNVLDVVDRKTSTVLRHVPIGKRPNNVAITPDGKRVYICIREESWVDVVDTDSLERVKRVPVGRSPHNVYCTPDGKHMVATSLADHKLTVIDIKTEEPEFDIPLDGVPRPVAIEAAADHSPARLFVQFSNLHGFEVVDYVSRKTIDKITLPDPPAGAKPLIPETFSHGIGVAPDGKTLWVNSMLDNSVSVYSLPSLQRVDTIKVGRAPDWIAFTPDSKLVYVSNAGADSVSAIDARSRKELARIPVGKVPKRLIAVELPD